MSGAFDWSARVEDQASNADGTRKSSRPCQVGEEHCVKGYKKLQDKDMGRIGLWSKPHGPHVTEIAHNTSTTSKDRASYIPG